MCPTRRLAALLTLLLCLSALSVQAQTINGSISGKVVDASGAVVPGATISVKNLETGLVREAQTDEFGVYHVRALAVGRYSVSFAAAGFATLVRHPIDVQMAADVTVEAALTPGASQQVVTVTGEAPLIETTQSQLTKGVTTQQLLELPGLNAQAGLALLFNGAVPNQNGRPGSGYSMNGGRTRSNNFMIDGANNNDQSLSTPRLNLAPEYMQEFRLIANNFSAEYGRNSGTVLSQITRSGSNEFHGVERWSWLGNGLDSLTTNQQRTWNTFKARGLSDGEALHKARAVVVENAGVLSLGGPVKKDRSFFFLGYDIDRYRTTAVPTAAAILPAGYDLLKANQSAFAPGTLDFLQKTFPAANDPTSRGSINVQVPNGPLLAIPLGQISPGLSSPLSYATNTWRWIARSDTKLSKANTLTVRYVIRDSADPGAPSAFPGNSVGQNLRDQSATLNDTHIINASTLNEARLTYVRRGIHFPENFPQAFQISGFASIGNINYPQYRIDNGYEYTDNFTMIRGRHAVKAGFNLYRPSMYSMFAPTLRGQVIYPSLQQFLLDQNATFAKFSGTPDLTAVTNEWGAFAQDDFRVLPNLTLNLGLRYEYSSAPLGYFSNAQPDINNLGPRIGFAWRPRGSGGWLGKALGGDRLSVRGGFSLTYDQIFQNVLLNVSRNYPRGVNYSYGPASGKALFLPANQPVVPTPEQYKQQGFNPDALDIRLFSPNQRVSQPYGMQASLGIERQLFTNYAFKLFYVGTRGIRLIREYETNYGFFAAAVNANPSTYAAVIDNLKYAATAPGASSPVYRINPVIGSRVVGAPIAQSTYHSLQASLEKRFANGLQFMANYTWSSFINDSDDILGGQTNNTVGAVPFNFKLERGRSGFDQPQRLVISYVYQFPFFKAQKGLWGRLAGGFEVTGVTTFASGIPYTILNADNALGIIPSGAVGTVHASQRASVNLGGVRGTATASGVANPYYVYNANNSGIIGTAGRNTERTGGTNNFDIALTKTIRTVGERHNLQLRWEVFDAFNHRNFTVIPANTVTVNTNNTLFMNLGQTNVSGRTMIISARYMF